MYMSRGRRLKISLWFIILMILFIVALIFTFIHISNSSKANTDDYVSNVIYEATASPERTAVVKISKKEERNNLIDLNSLSEISTTNTTQGQNNNTTNTTNTSNTNVVNNKTTDSTASANTPAENTNTVQNTAQPEEKTYKLNNHTYKFSNNQSVSLENNNSNQYVKYEHDDFVIRMNTDTLYYNNLKKKTDIKEFLQSNYKIEITSDVKSGNINGMNIIVCTFTEKNNAGYLVITKLNESEIAYFKIYRKSDMTNLISNIAQPLEDISSIINNSIK